MFVSKSGRKVQSSILPHTTVHWASRPGPPSRGGAREEGTRTQTKWFLAGENFLASNNSWGA